MNHPFLSPAKIREQRLLQNVGKLESIAAFEDVRNIWLCPLLHSDPVSWVLVYITHNMELVSDFAKLCKQNSEGADLPANTVRINTANMLLGGKLLKWSAVDLLSDVLFLPSNWLDPNVMSHLEIVYGFSDSSYFRSLQTTKRKAIFVLGD